MALVAPDFLTLQVVQACRTQLREPITVFTDDATGLPVLTFNPTLTPTEQTTLNNITAAIRSQTGLSTTDYAAVRAQMQILRDLRQLGRNAFVAQTQAQINRSLYDATVAITEIFLKVFRDP